MKEIGKLIELLNEYIPKGWEVAHGGKSIFYEGLNYTDRVISKSFGFIKWLVENDKIDRDKVNRESRKLFVGELRPRTPRYKLLILLSISDTPIEDLISYLHE